MDIIVTISETVRKRIRRFLRHDSQVIYPPCETERFRFLDQENFYLSTARLDPLKRIDVIVRAFLKMPEKNLVVVSGGSEIRKIKEAAEEAKNIQVLGWVNEERLIGLMGKCIASIYIPRDEDFGLSPVESMAAGKPVIGVREGGLLETISDFAPVKQVSPQRNMLGISRGKHFTGQGFRPGETGFAFHRAGISEVIGHPSEIEKKKAFHEVKRSDRWGRKDLLITECGVLVPEEPKVEHIIEAVEWMTPKRALKMRGACEERAKRFDKSVFIEKMREVVESS
jgi:glycosyltransferase involved in cell wall biosynthesis